MYLQVAPVIFSLADVPPLHVESVQPPPLAALLPCELHRERGDAHPETGEEQEEGDGDVAKRDPDVGVPSLRPRLRIVGQVELRHRLGLGGEDTVFLVVEKLGQSPQHLMQWHTLRANFLLP